MNDAEISPAMLRAIIDSTPVPMALNDEERITFLNPAFTELFGYTLDDIPTLAAWWPKAYPEPTYRAWVSATWSARLDDASRTGMPFDPMEVTVRGKHGADRIALVSASPLQGHSLHGVHLVVLYDITERRAAEEKLRHSEQQLVRAQRMESIGTLAGGIAHDLNNVLAPIVMAIDVLRVSVTEPEDRELLDTIGSSAKRGAAMVRQVLSFARGSMDGRRLEVQTSHLIRDVEKFARDTFPRSIRITSRPNPELWTVVGDPTQLQQLLVNLCVNARDAMPEGGELGISAENLAMDAQYASMYLEAKAGPHVVIQVEDTGTGMAPATLDKIFDPFFTTRPLGKGTGLGLSTALAIARGHGGFIRATSTEGAGSRFRLYLPAHVDATEPGDSPAVSVEPVRGQGQMVLVVDDEAAIRLVTRQTLEAYGYRALVAGDGAEAVALYAQHRAEIAVVLTDMMMPVMDGASTIHALMRLNPDIRIVATSGVAANGGVARTVGEGVRQFLAKPYTAETLLQALQAALADVERPGWRNETHGGE